MARVPVFYAAPTRSSSEPRSGGKKKDGKKGDGDNGASRRVSSDGEVEEVELNVLGYNRGRGDSLEQGRAL